MHRIHLGKMILHLHSLIVGMGACAPACQVLGPGSFNVDDSMLGYDFC